MQEHTLKVLEFEQLKNIIVGFSKSSLGKRKINSMVPCSDMETIVRFQNRTREFIRLLSEETSVPGEGATDISYMLDQLRIEGTVIDSEGFMLLLCFLTSSRQMKSYLLKSKLDIPILKAQAEEMPDLTKLEKAISFVFNEDGEVKDSASKQLKSIRSEIKSIRKKILKSMQGIIDHNQSRDSLSNDQVTIREDRYVLFVKSERRSVVSGVIHDKSMSGATCFIEPAEVIQDGNRLRALKFDERNEILRIKRFLTGIVRDNLDDLSSTVEPMGELEAFIASARFGLKYNMISPKVSDCKELKIIGGKHPLLLDRIGDKLVSMDIDLNKDSHTVIITGPNMGGKTVTLKTVGLLCLMFQTGFPVPVKEGSVFPVYKNIFADVGDEQSIENDMSTFSSHISGINDILNHKCDNSLVLIDEFGTGTDPLEGAALALAILQEMIKKKMFVVANTHLFQLKLYASNTEGVRNASLIFDDKTNAPTYQFLMDIPGSSNALQMAKNLGVKDEIIENARRNLGSSPAEIDELIRQLHQERIKLISDRKKCAEDYKKSQNLIRRYRYKLNKFDDENTHKLSKKLNDLDDYLKKIKKDYESAVSGLDKDKVQSGRRIFESYHNKIRQDKKDVVRVKSKDIDQSSEVNFKVGDVVIVAPFMFEGKIVDINHKRKKAIVLSKNRQVDVPLSNLSMVSADDKNNADDKSVSFHLSCSERSSFNPTLDLRGKYVEDALPLLEKHLSDAVMFSFKSFTVIHGFGTGRLKKAVTKYLSDQPQIKKIRHGGEGEGGLGVTVAEFIE